MDVGCNMEKMTTGINFNIFIIAYSTAVADTTEAGYQILDNRDNFRPDWREYWPIRNYITENVLSENEFYGFFSPRFLEKTGLSYDNLITYLNSRCLDFDVFTFSHQFDIGAFFQNVFYGGELMSPGFLDAAQRVFDRNSLDVNLGSLFMDSRTTVFSNYVVARPAYWRKWLELGEMVFSIAESNDPKDTLGSKLREATTYDGGVPRKVFVIEAIASLVLHLMENMRVHAYDTLQMPWAWSGQLGAFKDEAIHCDALKTAAIAQGRPRYEIAFRSISFDVLEKSRLIQKDTYMLRDPIYDAPNKTLLEAIPFGLTNIVEIGGFRGSLASAYKSKTSGCRWVCISDDKDHHAAMSRSCDSVVSTDTKFLIDQDLSEFSEADAWVFENTLEKMNAPWTLLAQIRKIIKSSACIVFSIQNSQHWYFQARLASGQFRYEPNTVMEASHLRLFTRTSILEMLKKTGYEMEHGVSVAREYADCSASISAIRGLAEAAGGDPDIAARDALAFHYVMRAVPV